MSFTTCRAEVPTALNAPHQAPPCKGAGDHGNAPEVCAIRFHEGWHTRLGLLGIPTVDGPQGCLHLVVRFRDICRSCAVLT